jgi:hypothetical protein
VRAQKPTTEMDQEFAQAPPAAAPSVSTYDDRDENQAEADAVEGAAGVATGSLAKNRSLDIAAKESPPKQQAVSVTRQQVAQINSALKRERCEEAVLVSDKLRAGDPKAYQAQYGKSVPLTRCRQQVVARQRQLLESQQKAGAKPKAAPAKPAETQKK